MVTAGQDTVSGALHFYSPYIPTPSWAQGKTPLSRPATEYLINVSAQGKKFHGASFLFFNNIN